MEQFLTLRMIAELHHQELATIRYWSTLPGWPRRINERRPYRYDAAAVATWFETNKSRPRPAHTGRKYRQIRDVASIEEGTNGCLNFQTDHPERCAGPVAYHRLPSEASPWRRCETHWQAHIVNIELIHLDADLAFDADMERKDEADAIRKDKARRDRLGGPDSLDPIGE